MWTIRRAALALLLVLGTCSGVPREGYGPGMQDWGFVEVREGAHMFWWLYYTTADVDEYTDRPLVMWLHGGPGASAMYGNFEELGPMTLEGEERNTTWVKNYNVLFVENPVGTGFSYVEDGSLLVKNNDEITKDLMTFTMRFYEMNPEFKTTPLHIYGLSYAGKMAPEFAYVLDNAIKNGEIDIQLESVAIIAPWVSPIDSMRSYAGYLLNLGMVDTKGYREVQATVSQTENLLNEGRFVEASETFGLVANAILEETLAYDWYNVLIAQNFESARSGLAMFAKALKRNNKTRADLEDRDQLLQDVMRDSVAPVLQLPPESVFHSLSQEVYDSLTEDFLKPITHIIELLLNSTSLDVIVVTGQLDLIVATPGNVAWLEKIQWDGRKQYLQAPRNGIGPHGFLEGYQKSFGKLHVYWALRAGHMAHSDNPVVMDYILQKQMGVP